MHIKNVVKGIQDKLDQLGFPDMRQDIQRGLDSGTHFFVVSCLRHFNHPPTGSSDFLQYDVTIAPPAKDDPIRHARLTLLRVLSSKDRSKIQVSTKQAKFIDGPLPTIEAGYRYLKNKLDSPTRQHKVVPNQKDPVQRLFKPNRGRGKGYQMP